MAATVPTTVHMDNITKTPPYGTPAIGEKGKEDLKVPVQDAVARPSVGVGSSGQQHPPLTWANVHPAYAQAMSPQAAQLLQAQQQAAMQQQFLNNPQGLLQSNQPTMNLGVLPQAPQLPLQQQQTMVFYNGQIVPASTVMGAQYQPAGVYMQPALLPQQQQAQSVIPNPSSPQTTKMHGTPETVQHPKSQNTGQKSAPVTSDMGADVEAKNKTADEPKPESVTQSMLKKGKRNSSVFTKSMKLFDKIKGGLKSSPGDSNNDDNKDNPVSTLFNRATNSIEQLFGESSTSSSNATGGSVNTTTAPDNTNTISSQLPQSQGDDGAPVSAQSEYDTPGQPIYTQSSQYPSGYQGYDMPPQQGVTYPLVTGMPTQQPYPLGSEYTQQNLPLDPQSNFSGYPGAGSSQFQGDQLQGSTFVGPVTPPSVAPSTGGDDNLPTPEGIDNANSIGEGDTVNTAIDPPDSSDDIDDEPDDDSDDEIEDTF